MVQSDGIELISCVKIREKFLGVGKYVSFDIHESPLSQFETIVLLDICRKTWIDEGKDVEENKIFKEWSHLFVCRKILVTIMDPFVLSSYIV